MPKYKVTIKVPVIMNDRNVFEVQEIIINGNIKSMDNDFVHFEDDQCNTIAGFTKDSWMYVTRVEE